MKTITTFGGAEMNFQSILYDHGKEIHRFTQLDFLVDLNIDQIYKAVQDCFPEQDVKRFWNHLPEDKGCSLYRQEIYRDVKERSLNRALENYLKQIRQSRTFCRRKEKAPAKLQRQFWHLREVSAYCQGLKDLNVKLDRLRPASAGLSAFHTYLRSYLSGDFFSKMQERSGALIHFFETTRLVLRIDGNQFQVDSVSVVEGLKTDTTYEAFLQNTFPVKGKTIQAPFSGDINLCEFEAEILDAFQGKHKYLFRDLAQFDKDYENYLDPTLDRFHEELPFYLSFCRFEDQMTQAGCVFCVPSIDDTQPFEASGLYDLALACRNIRTHIPIVSNEFIYKDGEQFLVVNGPNQGGKTTFARSMGQLVYFTLLGLDVPASSANVLPFTDILTHFSVEESVETGYGKLKEELVRLAPMMKKDTKSAFVIINELFTTAANYDACIMGKKVLEHFIARDCHGIYVTHLWELGRLGEQVVSMRADIDEKDHHKRTFRIIRDQSPPETAYAGDVVEKHHLTYEEIMARMAESTHR